MRIQDALIFGVSCEVIKFARIFLKIDQGFSLVALDIDAVFVAVATQHAPDIVFRNDILPALLKFFSFGDLP